jgi:hypothetical protein
MIFAATNIKEKKRMLILKNGKRIFMRAIYSDSKSNLSLLFCSYNYFADLMILRPQGSSQIFGLKIFTAKKIFVALRIVTERK